MVSATGFVGRFLIFSPGAASRKMHSSVIQARFSYLQGIYPKVFRWSVWLLEGFSSACFSLSLVRIPKIWGYMQGIFLIYLHFQELLQQKAAKLEGALKEQPALRGAFPLFFWPCLGLDNTFLWFHFHSDFFFS